VILELLQRPVGDVVFFAFDADHLQWNPCVPAKRNAALSQAGRLSRPGKNGARIFPELADFPGENLFLLVIPE